MPTAPSSLMASFDSDWVQSSGPYEQKDRNNKNAIGINFIYAFTP